jgi:hypothetical protein
MLTHANRPLHYFFPQRPSSTQIRPSTALFLYNFQSKALHGVFAPTGPAGRDLEPDAWVAACGKKFPAQIRWARTAVDAKGSARGAKMPPAGPLSAAQVLDLKKLLGVPTAAASSSGTGRRPAPAAGRPLPIVTGALPPSVPFPRANAPAPPPRSSAAASAVREVYSPEELENRRIAEDGEAYCRSEFRDFYGSAAYVAKWNAATKATRCSRQDDPRGCNHPVCYFNHGPPPRRPLNYAAAEPAAEAAAAPAAAPAVARAAVPSGGGGGPTSAVPPAAAAPRAAAEEAVSPAAGVAASSAAAYVFVVSAAAVHESLAYNVAGDAEERLGLMQAAIGRGTALYLHCAADRRVHGVFLADGPPGLDLAPGFGAGHFPAQVVLVCKRTTNGGARSQAALPSIPSLPSSLLHPRSSICFFIRARAREKNYPTHCHFWLPLTALFLIFFKRPTRHIRSCCSARRWRATCPRTSSPSRSCPARCSAPAPRSSSSSWRRRPRPRPRCGTAAGR